MGMKSRVRLEYWQNNTKVSSDNAMLHPEGSDVVSEARIDALEFASLAYGPEAAWKFASAGAGIANANFLSAGLSSESLAENMSGLQTNLTGRTLIKSANLSTTYPHSLYNVIRLVFEAQSTDPLAEVGHAPPASSDSPAIQFQSNGDQFNRSATYIINLDELNDRVSANGGNFFSTVDHLHPFIFQFAAGSVLHTLTLNVFRQHEVATTAYTDVVYWMRRPGEQFLQMVAHRRLMTFSPRIDPMTPAVGDEFQFADVPLVVESGNFIVEGKPYDFVSLNFNVVSRRKHSRVRQPIEVAAEYVPVSGGTALAPFVTQPTLSPAMDDRAQVYLAEGIGSASVVFSPSDVSPGTMVFSAVQEPGGWAAQHDIRLFRVCRDCRSATSVSREKSGGIVSVDGL